MYSNLDEPESTGSIALDAAKIPALIKGVDRWVLWNAGSPAPNGKFSKFPINTLGRKVNGLAPENWLSFREAHAKFMAGKCVGIGFVLDGTPIFYGEDQLFLIALDFDNCETASVEVKKLWLKLGKPYVEVSPSGKGLRMFALSKRLLRGGNAGNGREMYSARRFMTVTGKSARGAICEATVQLQELHDAWFPEKNTPPKKHNTTFLSRRLTQPDRPESQEAIARIKEMLSFVSADCDYFKWRDIVWSIVSTGWVSAPQIARDWSMTVPKRFKQEAFNTLVRDYDPKRGITPGTLYHHAKLAGWSATTAPSIAVTNSSNLSVQSTGQARYKFWSAEEVKSQPIPEYRVRGLLPSEGLAAVYGPSGSGKSFLIADLCLAIASGRPDWFGRKIKQAPVIYVALEGSAGLRNRIAALEAHYKMLLPDSFRFLMGGLTLKNTSEIEEFANQALETVGKGGVVVIDTLNQAAPGTDENSSQDMSNIIAAAKLLGERLKGLVILVHHTGKDTSRGLRGHSSLGAALDAAIQVENKSGFRSWSATKIKDDALGGPQAFILKPYTVGTDEDGLEVTSCAVERSLVSHTQARPISGKNQISGMAAIRQCVKSDEGVLTEARAVEAIAGSLSVPPGRRHTIAKELLASLISAGHLVIDKGGVYIP